MKEELEPANVYEAIGGEPAFRLLVKRFYAGVEKDPVLRPLYPPGDLTASEDHLALFLIQYWGGPGTYSEERGHPRLRLRHQPFAIGQAERDAWFHHMSAAVESLALEPEVRKAFLDYFEAASFGLINRPV